jgi:cytochrome P450
MSFFSGEKSPLGRDESSFHPGLSREKTPTGPVVLITDPLLAYQVLTDDRRFPKPRLETLGLKQFLGESPLTFQRPDENWRQARELTEQILGAYGQERTDRTAALTAYASTFVHRLSQNTGKIWDAKQIGTEFAVGATSILLFRSVDVLLKKQGQLHHAIQQVKILGMASHLLRDFSTEPTIKGKLIYPLSLLVNAMAAGAAKSVDHFFSNLVREAQQKLQLANDLSSKLSQPELIAQLKTLVMAGIDTTASQVTSGLVQLGTNPELAEIWQNGKTSEFVRQTLFAHPPLDLYRLVAEGTVLGGVTLLPGEILQIDTQALHQTHPAVLSGTGFSFNHPDSQRHCPGEPAAKLELTLFFEQLRQEVREVNYHGTLPVSYQKGLVGIIRLPSDTKVSFQ